MRYKGELYRDNSGKYRWRVKADNGNIVADSGEGYENRGDALSIYATLHPKVPLEFLEDEPTD